MAKVISSKELTAFGRTDIEGEIRGFVQVVQGDEKILTMDKKLIIEAASPGHFPAQVWEQFGIPDMPPWSIEDQASALVKCVKAGAAAIHTHPRDPDAQYNHEASFVREVELAVQVLDKVFEKVDVVTLNHAWHPRDWEDLADADFIGGTREYLTLGKGNRYIQGHVIPTWINPKSRRGLLSAWFTADALKEGIVYLEENQVKPLIALHVDHLAWFRDNILNAGVLKTRPHLNIQEGKHGVNRSFADPMSYMNLISSIELVKKTVPDCTIGLHTGGRNWLPLTVMGILLGVDLVRVGIEDQFWALPHRDEVIKSPWESVEKVAQISRALGRDIATPAEAREIMSITLIGEGPG
jgi:3-keto-5-aminohexanoate cleavage enzyme